MERCVTYTTDPAILTLPPLGVWRLAAMVPKGVNLWVCHWERVV